MYVSPKIAKRRLGISSSTLRRYAQAGDIDFIKTRGGQHRYNISSFTEGNKHDGHGSGNLKYSEKRGEEDKKAKAQKSEGAIYVRVSSHGQKDDI
jgi:predicted site-specific integrase-resolvase